jgi:hypothetical protein
MGLLAPICTPPFQSRPDELTHSLAPSSGPASETPRKARSAGVKAPLMFGVRLGSVARRTEVTGNDLVEQLGDTSIGAARGFLEAGLRRWGHPPRVHFTLSRHALQCTALTRSTAIQPGAMERAAGDCF